MNPILLDQLCQLFGITTEYGEDHVSEATKRKVLSALGVVIPDLPVETLDAAVAEAGEDHRCFVPGWLEEAPAWGIFCQIYELRSETSWGIGDFGALKTLAETAARAGADFLGVNPVHALFAAEPMRRSPFMPSNRRFLNPLYIDMTDLPGPAIAPEGLAEAEAAEAIDYDKVVGFKLGALEAVFHKTPFAGPRYEMEDFNAFCETGGTALVRHALFEALALHLVKKDKGTYWPDWPKKYRDPDSEAVRAFAKEHVDAVGFQLWLQWIASIQLKGVQDTARAAGMRIGLYLDLAVGEAPEGSAAWSAPETVLPGLGLGAPPDVFSETGQSWGLAVPAPTALAQDDFAAFRRLMDAQLRYAGALRIDHAMALRQLFVIPAGETADKGTHLRYPLNDMLRVLAEESQARRAIVIGEDLGYVPPGFRETMRAARLLSYRILYFEQDHGLFRRASTYPDMALACVSTHDLPVLSQWWTGRDVALRREFDLITSESANAQFATRAEERVALIAAFVDGGQLNHGDVDPKAETMPPEVLVAAYRFLAAGPSVLVGVRLADLAGPEAPTNVPGTTDAYPNWQLRSPTLVGDIEAQPAFQAVTAAMRASRPRREG